MAGILDYLFANLGEYSPAKRFGVLGPMYDAEWLKQSGQFQDLPQQAQLPQNAMPAAMPPMGAPPMPDMGRWSSDYSPERDTGLGMMQQQPNAMPQLPANAMPAMQGPGQFPQMAPPINAPQPPQGPQQGPGDFFGDLARSPLFSRGIFGAVAAGQDRRAVTDALVKQGLDPALARAAVANPQMLQAVIPQLFGPKDLPKTVEEYLVRELERQRRQQPGGPSLMQPGMPAAPGTVAAPTQPATSQTTAPATPTVPGMPAKLPTTIAELVKFQEDRKAAEVAAKKKAELGAERDFADTTSRPQRELGANIVVQDIDRALDTIAKNPNTTAGLYGTIASKIPGQPAHNVSQLVDTIKANIGFDKLSDMRRASPTGAALGSVTERETAFLQATLGALAQSQDSKQLVENLKRVKNVYLDIIHGPGKGPRDTGPTQTPSEPTRADIEAELRRRGKLR